MEGRFYSFNINNSETEVWNVMEFHDWELMIYFKIRDLNYQGWTYNDIRYEPYIELIENINLPMYASPNSIILNLDFENINQQKRYFRYKGLLTIYFRDNALNSLFE